VGGEGSVRGFREKSISPRDRDGGDSYFSFMSEFYIPIAYGFDLLGFFDGGNAFKSNRAWKPWDLRYGAGPGVRVNTPVGPLKFGYGFILNRRCEVSVSPCPSGKFDPIGTLYFGVGPI
jgi:outer membrane protein insertion porin family